MRGNILGKLKLKMGRSAGCALGLLIGNLCFGQQDPTAQNGPAQTSPAQAAPAPLPDAPSAAPAAKTSTRTNDEEQEKRIMGVLPNFRSVSAGAKVPKETLKQKLVTATEDNFDYTSLFFAGVIAGDSFVSEATPEFHQGAAGYARYYWHTVADQSAENYFVELILPVMTHEDSRYFAMGREGGSVMKRAGYALSRVVVTRTDEGKPTFNISEIAGSAAAVSVSTLYYPAPERTVDKGLRNWGLDVTYDGVAFMFHEFWPDIRNAVFGRKGSKLAAAH